MGVSPEMLELIPITLKFATCYHNLQDRLRKYPEEIHAYMPGLFGSVHPHFIVAHTLRTFPQPS